METRIRIMDLDIDMISTDAFLSKTEEYLTDDYLNVILFASTELLEEAAEHTDYRELLSRADLILPGEEALLSMHHLDVLEVAGMVINHQCFDQLLGNIQEKTTMYLVARTEVEVERFLLYVAKQYPAIHIVGTCCKDLEQSEELIINEINSLAPDILVISIDTPLQERWILRNCTKMNTKLCFGIGAVTGKILENYGEIPKLIQTLRLESLYNIIKKSKRLFRIRQARIFKRKIAHYKNKKSE